MRRVIFDSSFLMAVAENPTAWLEDIGERIGRFDPTLLDCVRAELDRIAAGGGKRSKTARVALSLAEGFSALPCGGATVDDEIASAAVSKGAAVATSDAALAESLRAMKVVVISLSRRRVAVR